MPELAGPGNPPSAADTHHDARAVQGASGLSERTVIIVRPHGGLNDNLVQLERCRRLACRETRLLIADMAQSGIPDAFHETFVPTDRFGCEVLSWNDEIGTILDAVASVAPADAIGNISGAGVRAYESDGADCVETRKFHLDFGRPYSEQALVHATAGGGIAGFRFLRRVRLVPALANAVVRRLVPLDSDYDAIHIRHTDIRSDADRLLRRVSPVLDGRTVLLATDNAALRKRAAALLPASTRIVTVSDIPDLGGEALHMRHEKPEQDYALSIWTDLIALARARRLVFAPLENRGRRAQFSGFSILAEMLRLEPTTIDGLLSLADPDVLAALPAPDRRWLGPRRTLLVADMWRWNFPARWQTMRLTVKKHLPDAV